MRDPTPLTPPPVYLDHAAARRIIVGVLLTMLLAALDQVMVATVGGPLFGGFIAGHFHWSWFFWLNLPLCALAYLLTHNVLQRLPRHDRPHALDMLGAALMVGAAIALMLALTWGGRRYPWASPQGIALFAASAALWLLFAWRLMTAQEPFIPLSVLRDGAVRVGTAAAFLVIGAV